MQCNEVYDESKENPLRRPFSTDVTSPGARRKREARPRHASCPTGPELPTTLHVPWPPRLHGGDLPSSKDYGSTNTNLQCRSPSN